MVTDAENDASTTDGKNKELDRLREETSTKCNDLTNQLEEKTLEVKGLRRTLEETRDDAEKRLTEEVSDHFMNCTFSIQFNSNLFTTNII